MVTPFHIRVVRTRKRRATGSSPFRYLSKLRREALHHELVRWSVLEMLFFAALAVISAWPLYQAIVALRFL